MMEKALAAKLIDSVLQLSDQLNEIDEQLQALPEGAEREALLRASGSVMFELDAGLIRPLVRQYPDLDPDR
jgi:hypothetical protein